MRLQTFIGAAVLFIGGYASAQDNPLVLPPELLKKREEFMESMQRVKAPILTAYVRSLASLKAKLMRDSNLEGALTVKTEMTNAKGGLDTGSVRSRDSRLDETLAQKGSKLPPDLVALQKRCERDIQEATKPLKERYAGTLQSVLRSATQRGDLAGAIAIKEEISSIGDLRISPVGKWTIRWAGQSRIREFKAHGTCVRAEASQTGQPDGTWSLSKDALNIKWRDGTKDTWTAPLNPRGTKGRSSLGFEFLATRESS